MVRSAHVSWEAWERRNLRFSGVFSRSAALRASLALSDSGVSPESSASRTRRAVSLISSESSLEESTDVQRPASLCLTAESSVLALWRSNPKMTATTTATMAMATRAPNPHPVGIQRYVFGGNTGLRFCGLYTAHTPGPPFRGQILPKLSSDLQFLQGPSE